MGRRVTRWRDTPELVYSKQVPRWRHPGRAGTPGGKSFAGAFVRLMHCRHHILAIDAEVVETEFVEFEKLCKRHPFGSGDAHFTEKTQ